MPRFMSMAQLKAHLSEVVGEVLHTRQQVVIEKHGKAVAMLVPIVNEKPAGLLGLVGTFDEEKDFARAIDAVVKSRKADKRRKVPRLK